MITQELVNILAEQSIEELLRIQRFISEIINKKESERDLDNILNELELKNPNFTLEDKVRFFLAKEMKLKAIQLVKKELDLSLRDSLEFVNKLY